VQLVGIAEADTELAAKYRSRFGLDETLFYKQEANMIETDPPAGHSGLYIDRRAPPGHRDRRAVWRVRDGGEAADHFG
jgi:hypothetical protein